VATWPIVNGNESPPGKNNLPGEKKRTVSKKKKDKKNQKKGKEAKRESPPPSLKREFLFNARLGGKKEGKKKGNSKFWLCGDKIVSFCNGKNKGSLLTSPGVQKTPKKRTQKSERKGKG